MKKKFFVTMTAALLTFTATFAQDAAPVPAAIVRALQQEFRHAEGVQWKTAGNLYKASWIENGRSLDAFYSFDGKLVGVSRKLTVEQLPLRLSREMAGLSSAEAASDLFELLTERGTEYFVTITEGSKAKNYKSTGDYWYRY